jgi:hypothetical protein
MAHFANVTLLDVCEMDFLEERTLQLLAKNPKISPDFLANKLKIRMDTARKLYHWAYQIVAIQRFHDRFREKP